MKAKAKTKQIKRPVTCPQATAIVYYDTGSVKTGFGLSGPRWEVEAMLRDMYEGIKVMHEVVQKAKKDQKP